MTSRTPLKPVIWTRPHDRTPASGPLLLVDRDGVIIEDGHYLDDPRRVTPVPGSLAALARLRAAGWRLACVSNQSGLGRGLIDPAAFAAVQSRVDALLAAAGADLDVMVYCPHAPEAGCACRKPGLGMVEAVSDLLAWARDRAAMAGDKPADADLGAAAGVRTFLVRTGRGAEADPARLPPGTEIVADLAAVAARLLGDAVR